MGPTPEQQRNIDKERKSFEKSWYLDLTTVEIRHNKIPWWQYPLNLIYTPKNSIFSMYWYLKHERLSNEKARCFNFPLTNDQMPIKGQPSKYKLNEPWNIPKSDLKFLSGGPLVDQNMNLLVPPDFVFKNFYSNMVPVIKVLTAIVLFVAALIKLWSQIQKIFV